jgi:hypothetical protein
VEEQEAVDQRISDVRALKTRIAKHADNNPATHGIITEVLKVTECKDTEDKKKLKCWERAFCDHQQQNTWPWK